ncbi:MAG: serine hydrolase, partial [bacterium]|nr:serine hydrolase [bacterium]
DGWLAMVDEIALGKQDAKTNAIRLWTEPGGGYSYATSSIHLASIMLRHVTGMELERYIEEKLAREMGWGFWTFGYRRREIPHTPGGGGIAPRATDMLRFGYLLLRQGKWRDRQLVPAEYVKHCGSASPYNPHTSYSLQFTTNSDGHLQGVPRDAFWKIGSGGHALYIVPSLDLVIYKLGGRDGQYDPGQLRRKPPETGIRRQETRDGWKASVDAQTAAAETLRMVVAAVLDR